MFAWSLTAILLFWVCFLLYMIFAGLFGCHKKNKIEEIDLTNSRGKYEWDGKEYDTLEEQSAAKVKYFLQLGRTRQTLWSAVQMLTQKLCCQTIHDCPKVVPLHYESE